MATDSKAAAELEWRPDVGQIVQYDPTLGYGQHYQPCLNDIKLTKTRLLILDDSYKLAILRNHSELELDTSEYLVGYVVSVLRRKYITPEQFLISSRIRSPRDRVANILFMRYDKAWEVVWIPDLNTNPSKWPKKWILDTAQCKLVHWNSLSSLDHDTRLRRGLTKHSMYIVDETIS